MRGLIRSIVRVELEVSTRDESVDIEAESTSTTTIPSRISGNAVSSIDGTILSNASLPFTVMSSLFTKSLPKPPIKYEPHETTIAKSVEITVPCLIALSSLMA